MTTPSDSIFSQLPSYLLDSIRNHRLHLAHNETTHLKDATRILQLALASDNSPAYRAAFLNTILNILRSTHDEARAQTSNSYELAASIKTHLPSAPSHDTYVPIAPNSSVHTRLSGAPCGDYLTSPRLIDSWFNNLGGELYIESTPPSCTASCDCGPSGSAIREIKPVRLSIPNNGDDDDL
ncbi:MAG: hypothetical protein ACK4Y5_20670 [Acetobacteraceae bacterium]|jgi:hypothetical protein